MPSSVVSVPSASAMHRQHAPCMRLEGITAMLPLGMHARARAQLSLNDSRLFSRPTTGGSQRQRKGVLARHICTRTGLRDRGSPPCHICAGTALNRATSRRDCALPCHILTGTGSPLRRDWAQPWHICAGTALSRATSAPGLGSPLHRVSCTSATPIAQRPIPPRPA